MAQVLNFNSFDDLKFLCSEKATNFCKIFTSLLSYAVPVKNNKGEDFAKFCGLLRIYEL